jgi:hypothetical protein
VTKLRIGVDFDNTLISYDRVFRDLAARRGWVPRGFPASKEAVRRRLLSEDRNDLRWQRLQAEAYGPRIFDARPFAGFAPWLRQALKAGHEVFIVSHKSEASHFDPSVRLRDSARTWLKARGLAANAAPAPLRLKPGHVLFTSTREEKIAQIARLRLDVFIDDLLPVLEDPRFPKKVLRLHFGRQAPARVPALASWSGLERRLKVVAWIGPEAARAIHEILGASPVAARPIAGGNNRLIAVRLANGRKVLVKRYWLDARDPRDRAGTEFLALELMRAARLRRVPRALYKDPQGAFTILSLLEGRPMRGRGRRAHFLEASSFIGKLIELGRLPANRGVPEAADSRRCLADYPRHIERRLSQIMASLSRPGVPARARRFMREEVLPLKERLLQSFRARAAAGGFDLKAPTPPSERILSPSDFGCHNAVLSPSGRVQFLDFEYFGRDDAAKLAADFIYHAGQKLAPELSQLFVEELSRRFEDPQAFLRRLELVRPLVGLEWVLIILNVLSPEQLARRRFSAPRASARTLILGRLAAAQRLLASLR